MKKGQLGFLQKLMLLLVGAILLFLVFGVTFLAKMKSSGDIEKCRTSATIVDKGRDLTGAEIMNLDCRMRDIAINPADITFKGEFNKNMLFRIMAEEMKTCWYMMGDGRLKPFYQKYIGTATRPCIICAKITFDERIYPRMGVVDGFNSFMDTRMEGSEITYRDYLSETQTVGGGFLVYWYSHEESLREESAIDTSKSYYIIYNVVQHHKVMNKDARWYRTLQELFGVTEKAGLYDSHFLYLIKSESISEAGCDYIGNEAR